MTVLNVMNSTVVDTCLPGTVRCRIIDSGSLAGKLNYAY